MSESQTDTVQVPKWLLTAFVGLISSLLLLGVAGLVPWAVYVQVRVSALEVSAARHEAVITDQVKQRTQLELLKKDVEYIRDAVDELRKGAGE